MEEVLEDQDFVYQRVIMKTFGTIFSGGELFGIGAKQAGYEHVWGVEYDDKIASVARLNGFNVLTGNVLDVERWEDLPMVDHFHASPPCPNFSVAKTNGGETELDIQLADAVCWFIRNKARRTVTIENVMAYRKSESFKRIMKTLEDCGYFVEWSNLNAADFGVPQTRRRLIVRASRELLKPYPAPVKWVGWYEAIEDLIPTLPETEFAPWQMDRSPEEYRNFLLGQGSRSTPKSEHEPTETITANNNQSAVKAFLTSQVDGRTRKDNLPALTVMANEKQGATRAFIVNTKDPHGKANRFTVRHGETPMYTVLASANEARNKAFIVDGQANSHGESVTVPHGNEPVYTQSATQEKRPARAFVGRGWVVKMTVQALGRFQTVPDWYQGLTVKINGNGIPCLMAEKIMETMQCLVLTGTRLRSLPEAIYGHLTGGLRRVFTSRHDICHYRTNDGKD